LIFVCLSTNLLFGVNKNTIISALALVEKAGLTVEEKAIEKQLIKKFLKKFNEWERR